MIDSKLGVLENKLSSFRLHQHITISNPEEVNKMEADFIEEIQKRGADFKYFQDIFGDIPDDRGAKMEEKTEKLEKATTLSNIYGALKEKVWKSSSFISWNLTS